MAPSCNDSRVSNHHCQLHAEQFKPKYLRYKELQSKLVRLDNLDRLTVKELIQRYNSYSRVYKLRRSCMRKYFRLEHWDQGHTLMSVKIWQDLVKIERWITKLVSIPKPVSIPVVEVDSDEEEYTEIEEPEQIIEKQKKFSVWESLNNPQSCLARRYQTELNEVNRLSSAILTWLTKQYGFNFDTEDKRKNIGTASTMVIQAWNYMNASIIKKSTKKEYYSPAKITEYQSCCLRKFFEMMIKCGHVANLTAYLLAEILSILSEIDLDSFKVSFEWNLPIKDEEQIIFINEDFEEFASVRSKHYFCIHAAAKCSVKTNEEYLPMGMRSIEEWLSTPKKKLDKCTQYRVVRTMEASRWYMIGGVVDSSMVLPVNFSHNCGIMECSQCIQEINEEKEWGTLHPK